MVKFFRIEDGAVHAFQTFVRSMLISSGVLVGWLGDDKVRQSNKNDFKAYCCQEGVLLEYTSTNKPQGNDRSKSLGKTLAAMVLCMLADSGLPTLFGEGLMVMAAYLDNKSHSYGTDNDLLPGRA